MSAAWILFRGLNLSYVARHRLRSALSVAGIALGITLFFGAIIDNTSATASLEQLTGNTQGSADLEITTPTLAGIDASVSERAAAVSGVKVAAPVLQERVLVRGSRGTAGVILLGYDNRLLALSAGAVRPERLRLVRRGVGLVVTPQLWDQVGHASDGSLEVTAKGVSRRVQVVAETPADIGSQLNGGRVAGVSLGLAQEILAHPKRVTSIFVQAQDRTPGAVAALHTRLQSSLGPTVQVLPADHSIKELQISTAQFRSISNLLSSLVLLLGAYVVFITMSMAAVERRREFSIMLALGDSRRRLLLRFLAEAALIGIAGGLVGLLGGYLVGIYLVGGTPAYIEDVYGFHTNLVVPPWGIAASVGAAVLVAVLAALPPALSVLRLPPAEALRPQPAGEAPVNPRLQLAGLLVGVALAAAAVAGTVVRPSAGFFLADLLFVGGVLAVPSVFTVAVRVVAAVLIRSRLRLGAGLTQLAGANLVQSQRRTVASISAAAFALGLVIADAASAEDVARTVHNYANLFASVDIVAQASDDPFSLVPFSPATTAVVAAVPGVAAVHPFSFSFLSWHGRRVLLIGGDFGRGNHFDYLAGDSASGVAAMNGDGVVIASQVATLDRVGVGDRVVLPSPTGDHAYRVGAVVKSLSWTEGVMFIGNRTFARDYQQPEVNQFFVDKTPGADFATVRRDIQTRLGPSSYVVHGTDFVGFINQTNEAIQAPFFHIRNISVVVAVLAVFNTMLIAVLQRRREIGVLYAIGMQTAQLRAALLLEATLMVLVALAAATILGTGLQILGLTFIAASTGLPLRWSWQPLGLLLGALSAMVMVIAGSAYPARQAGRVPVLEAIAYE